MPKRNRMGWIEAAWPALPGGRRGPSRSACLRQAHLTASSAARVGRAMFCDPAINNAARSARSGAPTRSDSSAPQSVPPRSPPKVQLHLPERNFPAVMLSCVTRYRSASQAGSPGDSSAPSPPSPSRAATPPLCRGTFGLPSLGCALGRAMPCAAPEMLGSHTRGLSFCSHRPAPPPGGLGACGVKSWQPPEVALLLRRADGCRGAVSAHSQSGARWHAARDSTTRLPLAALSSFAPVVGKNVQDRKCSTDCRSARDRGPFGLSTDKGALSTLSRTPTSRKSPRQLNEKWVFGRVCVFCGGPPPEGSVH